LLDGKGLELSAGDDGIEEVADGLLVVVGKLRNALEFLQEIALYEFSGGSCATTVEDQLVGGDAKDGGELAQDLERGLAHAVLVAMDLGNPHVQLFGQALL